MANFAKAYDLGNASIVYYINLEKVSTVRIDLCGGSYKAIVTVDGSEFALTSFDSGTASDVESRVRILFGGLLGYNAAG